VPIDKRSKTDERRTSNTGKVELRVVGTTRRIVGYGAVFNTETVIGGFFRERLMPGAFSGVLKNDVRSLFNHDPNYVLGRTSAGTLTLSVDAVGLRYEVTPPAARADVVEALGRGDVTGSSFGFTVKRDSWTKPTRAGELPLRTIYEFRQLFDVGPVTYPAYDETSAEARSAAAANGGHRGPLATDTNAFRRALLELEDLT
jgi:HK97 family phage prohead protease